MSPNIKLIPTFSPFPAFFPENLSVRSAWARRNLRCGPATHCWTLPTNCWRWPTRRWTLPTDYWTLPTSCWRWPTRRWTLPMSCCRATRSGYQPVSSRWRRPKHRCGCPTGCCGGTTGSGPRRGRPTRRATLRPRPLGLGHRQQRLTQLPVEAEEEFQAAELGGESGGAVALVHGPIQLAVGLGQGGRHGERVVEQGQGGIGKLGPRRQHPPGSGFGVGGVVGGGW